MNSEGYLQLIMTFFIIVTLILIFILYSIGNKTNDRSIILSPGRKQWINRYPVIVNPIQQQHPIYIKQHLLGPGGTQWIYK